MRGKLAPCSEMNSRAGRAAWWWVPGPPATFNQGVSTHPSTESDYQVLRTGVDSLYLSYAGDLKPGMLETLEILKFQAQSEAPKEQAKAVSCLADHLSEILIQPPKITH
jgi:hypothetical protein